MCVAGLFLLDVSLFTGLPMRDRGRDREEDGEKSAEGDDRSIISDI